MPDKSFKRDQVIEIIGSVVKKLSAHDQIDNPLQDEIQSLHRVIEDLRIELNQIAPVNIHSHIPGTTDELSAIASTTEDATHTIMEACEHIQKELKDKDIQESGNIESELIRIIEACTFQDLTGQRISKISKALQQIDICARKLSQVLNERFADLNVAPLHTAPKDPLLNGPQAPGQGISQDEIDKLLNDFS